MRLPLISFEKRLISMKKDKRTQKQYPRISIFTKGYEIIEQTILNVNMLNELIVNILEETKQPIHDYLWCTPNVGQKIG